MAKNNENKAVDFNNPESVAQAIAEEEAQTIAEISGTTEKAPKPKKPKTVKVTYTADRDIKAGETIEFDYELPVSAGKRGVVAGIPLEEMSDDQLKIEYRNANSCFYKVSHKQNADPAAIAKAKDRLDAVLAMMEKKGIKPTGRGAAKPTEDVVAQLIKSGQLSAEKIQALLDASNSTNEAKA